MARLLLALGANRSGPWGPPERALERAVQALSGAGLEVVRASRVYPTAPLGPGRQAPYLNAVLVVEARQAPGALLRLMKRIERQAGRRLGRPLGPRELDLDLLDYSGRRLNWPSRRRERGRLALPHPEMHRRAFVLVPLLEVAPHWRHPVLGVGAHGLLSALGPVGRRTVRPPSP